MSVRSWLRRLFGERQPQPSPLLPRKPLIALVWLRRTVRDLDADEVAALAADALGEPFTSGDPEATDYFVTGCAPSLLLKRRDQTYLVHTFPRPYMDDPGAVAARASERQLKHAVANHQAWLSVDLLGDVPPDELEDVYRVIGRLMAALADDDCVALYCPEADRLSAPDAGLMPGSVASGRRTCSSSRSSRPRACRTPTRGCGRRWRRPGGAGRSSWPPSRSAGRGRASP